MENKNRKPQINIEANEEFIEELRQISKKIEIPYAQIAREAIAEKIIALKATHPRLQETALAK